MTIDFPMWVKTTRCATRTQSQLVQGRHGATRETETVKTVDRPVSK